MTAPGKTEAMTAGLVIGIGNPLRSDDGVGVFLARESKAHCGQSQSVVVRSAHQLTPELVLELARAKRVLFIDAWLPPKDTSPTGGYQPVLEPIHPDSCALAAGSGLNSHHLPPQQLLAIARLLLGRVPDAAWLRVPAWETGHGTTFSDALHQQLPAARQLLHAWIHQICTN